MKLCTGLPSYARLRATLDFVTAGLSGKQQGKLSQFSRFLLVLMKLRLNLLDADLARRFGVSPSTVSKIFTKWIHILYIRLQPLIRWPERDELLLAMPRAFRKHFKRCVCIIDCFEVFCERPSALMARAQTYSNYKHHNTTKFLIGITPQGVISFVSRGWGGRASDKHITENCGILKKLLPGDQVMADRGFTVQESLSESTVLSCSCRHSHVGKSSWLKWSLTQPGRYLVSEFMLSVSLAYFATSTPYCSQLCQFLS